MNQRVWGALLAVVCAALLGALVGACESKGSSPEHPLYTECWPGSPYDR